MAYKIVSATGAQSMAGSLPGPITWSGVIATYKQAAAATTAYRRLGLLGVGQ